MPEKKTLMMRLMEKAIDMKLEDILWADSEANVARALGIHYSTVSKWRKRLGGPTNGA